MVRKKTPWLSIALLLIMNPDVHPFQATIVKNVFRPLYMVVDSASIYVVDEKEIKVFYRTNGAYSHSIGKSGEGPGEFAGFPFPHILQDQVLVSSPGKVSFFGKNGAFIREFRNPGRTQWIKQVTPNRYIGSKLEPATDEFYITYNLLGEGLHVLKEFYRGRFILHKDRTMDLFELTFFAAWGGKIVYAHNDGRFAVDVMDPDGGALARIRRDETEIPFTKSDQEKMFAFYENHPLYRETFLRMKERIILPDRFPAILNCKVDDGKVYIFTFRVKEGKTECFVYNLDGSLVRRAFVELKGESPDRKDCPFAVFNDQLYQLSEDADDENWYLCVSEI